ncbi:MAG: hypothetical protein IMZ61_16060 [Planctomycetes bacterium]|nr:hypothetical protein [Planctomycetota bacterium]
MIEIIFTVDYEIYGNGEGSLRKSVFEPAERLRAIFNKWNTRFVTFVEVAELEMIEASDSDPSIGLVKRQIWDMKKEGFEIALHLHPQWCNAQYKEGTWALDYGEYNLCDQSRERIDQILDRSIEYLRTLVGEPDFVPFSFRAGNWLFQPSRTLSKALAERGIRVDSSLFKGGLQRQHRLDYRFALKNGYFWTFSENVNLPDPRGVLMEFPIYTRMQPIWKLLTFKRIGLQQKGAKRTQTGKMRLCRLLDYTRFWYPLKFDFCRMSIDELTQILEIEMRKDQKNPNVIRPIIAIGHTKDLADPKTIDALLSFLHEKHIKVTDFRELYGKIQVLRELMNEGGDSESFSGRN